MEEELEKCELTPENSKQTGLTISNWPRAYTVLMGIFGVATDLEIADQSYEFVVEQV